MKKIDKKKTALRIGAAILAFLMVAGACTLFISLVIFG